MYKQSERNAVKMVSRARGKSTALVLLLTAFLILGNESRPSLGATLHRPELSTYEHNEMVHKSPTMRRLSWWKWGKGENKNTEATAPYITESPLLQPISTTTKPSRWRSWFSSAKDKFSKAVDKVKTEMKEAKESYDRGVSFVGGAAKEGLVGAGRVISSGAKTVGNATITASRAIKAGAKKFGSMVKTGFQKIRIKFSGEEEKFKIVANRLKDKLEAGDEKALDLMKKLGINITFAGDKISGAHIANKNISVAEVLQIEGLLSNKSSSYHTAVEQPEEAESTSANDNPPFATEKDEFHSAEEYFDSVNSSVYKTDEVKYFNITPTIYLPELPETSKTNLPIAMSNKTSTLSTPMAIPSIASTLTIDTKISEASVSSTLHTHISSITESTPIVPKTAATRLSLVKDLIASTTPHKVSSPSSSNPDILEISLIPLLISSSPLVSDTSSSAATESSTLPITYTEISINFTDITIDETPYPNSTSSDFTVSSFSTDSTTEPPTETTSITTSSTETTSSTSITTSSTETTSSTSISTSTITTIYSSSTSPITTATETTSTIAPVTFTTSTISTTITPTTVSLPVNPNTLETTEAASPIELSKAPLNEYEAFPELERSKDEGTLTEAEPYEPPPFPDIFSNTEVHDRLKEFYDKGDFSHSDIIEIFNFDPDNYEYYDY